MRALRRFFKRLRSLATTQQDEDRLRIEIEDHLEMQTAANMASGMTAEEARRQAILEFGALEAIREQYRDQKGLPFMETLIQDVRHALIRLWKSPAFTITTVLTLALGIGATTSIFTLVHAVILRSLAVAKPHELYRLGKKTHCCVWGGYQQDKEFSIVSYELYKHFRDHTKGFVELAAFSAGEPLFGVSRATASESAHSYRGEYVSGNYFAMFGIGARAGRTLSASDDQPGAAPVAMMSFRLWQEKFGADPSIVGCVFNFNGTPFTVVGILPPGFFGDTLRDSPPDFFVPISTEPAERGETSFLKRPDLHWLDVIGRIQPGVSSSAIESQMRMELLQWLRSHSGDMTANDRTNLFKQTLYLSPGGAGITSMREQYEHWLNILTTVTAFVLLIVCANVANLMLVRGLERRRQMALSMALGASPWRMVKQSLTECLALSLVSGAAGLLIAYVGTRTIVDFAFPRLPGFAATPIDAAPSAPVLVFTFGVSVLTGIIFGIAPAWMATRVDPIEALRGSRSTERTGSLPRKMLVVFQAALSLVLLSASGLLTSALYHLENQDFGFAQEGRVVIGTDPMLARYNIGQLTPLYRRIHDAITSTPDVESAAFCGYAPQSGDSDGDAVFLDGHPPPGPNDDSSTQFDRATAGYFDVIGTPIIRGRGITEQDTETSLHVAVINQAFARKFFKNEDPIGKYFGRDGATRQYEVVGVSKDARYLTYALDEPISPLFIAPEAQHDVFPRAEDTKGDEASHDMGNLVIKARPGATVTDTQVRQAFASVDPSLPIIYIRSMKEFVATQFSQQRLIARLTSFFGLLSLVLASIGLYGVTAYNAGRRVNEIGIRVALGASRGQVIALVLRGSAIMVTFGLALGLPLTFAAGKFLGSQLYGMSPYNLEVTLSAVAVLAITALAAAFIPALRASSVSPLEALRAE